MPWALPSLCCCWRSESDGRPPAGQSCSCKSFRWDPSDAVKVNDISINVSWPYLCFKSTELKFTSRMKNLAVLAFPQVFFRRDTGLMFIPAVQGCKFPTLVTPPHTGGGLTNHRMGTHRWWPSGSWSCQCWNTLLQRRWRTRSPGPSASSLLASRDKQVTFLDSYRLLTDRWGCSNTKWTLGGSITLGKYES